MFKKVKSVLSHYGVKPTEVKKYYEEKEEVIEQMVELVGEEALIDLIYEYRGIEKQNVYPPPPPPPALPALPPGDIRTYLMMKRFYDTDKEIKEYEMTYCGEYILRQHSNLYDNKRCKIIFNITDYDEFHLWNNLQHMQDSQGYYMNQLFTIPEDVFNKKCNEMDDFRIHMYFEGRQLYYYFHF